MKQEDPWLKKPRCTGLLLHLRSPFSNRRETHPEFITRSTAFYMRYIKKFIYVHPSDTELDVPGLHFRIFFSPHSWVKNLMTDPDGTELWLRAWQCRLTKKFTFLNKKGGRKEYIYVTDIKEKWCKCGSAWSKKKCVQTLNHVNNWKAEWKKKICIYE